MAYSNTATPIPSSSFSDRRHGKRGVGTFSGVVLVSKCTFVPLPFQWLATLLSSSNLQNVHGELSEILKTKGVSIILKVYCFKISDFFLRENNELLSDL